MKRFVWRLQRVLDVKTKEEQTKKAELVKLTEKIAQTRSKLLTQKRILDNIIDDLTGQHPKKRLTKQEFFLRCSAANDEVIKELQKKLSELEQAQKQKIADVLKTKRFKEGLEKLRAQVKARFINEQEKLEQKELDERATAGFARKLIR
jgi:flagellar FliJ protein